MERYSFHQKIPLYSVLTAKMIAKVILVGLLLTTLSEAIPIIDKETITEVIEKILSFGLKSVIILS